MENNAEAQKRIDECRTTQATTLDLGGLALTQIPDAVFTLPQLTELRLGHWIDSDLVRNRITELPPAIEHLQNLTSLHLSNNQLSTLPDTLTRLDKLTNLNLRNNQLSTLPDTLTRLDKLTNLNLRNNQLSTLPDTLTRLDKLTNLNLRNNQLTTLPDAITRLANLTTLYLSDNQLSTLPDAITRLANLTTLYLSDNQLSTLPDAITRLANLTTLYLSNTQLNTLPDALTRLDKLTDLDLSNNQLSTLPDVLTRLDKLTDLDLSNNQLSTLPDVITRLDKLIELYLSNNQLSTLPDAITRLDKLTTLNLRDNQLSTLPEAITRLDKLTTLYLRNNQLSTLPDAITRLQNLTYLDLSNNQLSTLPDAITRLDKLTTLNLRDNQLSTLPDTITRLQNLTHLYLSDNQLSTLPDAITRLEKLHFLSVEDNPLLNPPLEVATRGMDAIRTYFAKFGTIDHLYEAKLLLVGEGRVGKTSLKKALTNANYTLHDERSTEGIDVQQWLIPACESGLAKEFRLNIWDFGGQEIYHHTHQFFLTQRSLYLLVTESRKEDKHDDFYYWLNIIRLLGGPSPVIMVLNKIDQPSKELPIKEYQEQFDNIVDYQRVSCAPGFGHTLVTLKESIRRWLLDARRMGHVGAPLPAAWVTIREAVEAVRRSGRDYISRSEFLALCRQHDLDEEIAVVLSHYFHDIGVFLHFDDDVALSETIFLNHDYVTDAVYKVLDNAEVKAQQGKFSERDLLLIWRDERYRAKRPELLALMMNDKFDLCYRLPNAGYLAPQLLPVDEQPYPWRTPAENLHFEYHYAFMPKGMLPRFIVKRHTDIYEQIQWRSGVLLEWGGTRALVRERYFERKLTIVLEGNNKRGMLEIIRKTIQEIHASFNQLAVDEMIPCHCPGCRPSPTPAFYPYALLSDYQQAGVPKIRCTKHVRNEVSVQALFNDVFLPPPREREEEERWRDLHIQGDLVLGNKAIAGDQVDGDKVGGDKVETVVGVDA